MTRAGPQEVSLGAYSRRRPTLTTSAANPVVGNQTFNGHAEWWTEKRKPRYSVVEKGIERVD